MGDYRFTYFNVRGRGEIIRLLFTVSGVKYEERTLDMQGADWLALKPSKFAAEKQ